MRLVFIGLGACVHLVLRLVSPKVTISSNVKVVTSGLMIDNDDLLGSSCYISQGDITQEVRLVKNLASSIAPL
jgi:uncharacterized protein YqfA (UPF0365 family)